MYKAPERVTRDQLPGYGAKPKAKRSGTRSPLKDLAELACVRIPAEGKIIFQAAIRTISESNQREHWTHKAKRAQIQRQQSHYAWLKVVKPGLMFEVLQPPYVVTITRIGPKVLDSDNLARSQKTVRDQVATELGIDDGSDLIDWRYDQEATGRREYAVRVEISSR